MSAGLLTGEKIMGPITTTGTAAIGGITDTTLSAGDNTFAVPTGAVKVLINLGTGVGGIVKLRTNLNSGDAGLQISPYSGTGWDGFDLPAGTTSVILNANGSVGPIELSFI